MKSIAPANPGQRGYKAHAVKRGETFAVLFPVLRLKPGFNERRIFSHLDSLAKSIQTNGFNKKTPIVVEWSEPDQRFYIIHGERRYRACERLVNTGIDPGPIWCVSESAKTDPLTQLFEMITTNQGEQFNMLEKGFTYLRMQTVKPGITGTEIADHVGETKQAVSNALRLAKLSTEEMQDAIIRELISCTTALRIVNDAGDDNPAEQNRLLLETLQSAQDSGKSHATPKHIPAPVAGNEPVAGTTSPSPSSGQPVPTTLSGPTEIIVPPDDDSSDQDSSNPQSETNPHAPADPGAIKRIQNAPSSNRDGSSGPGSGKYEAPDKRMKSVEKLLEELDALKDEAKDPARILTAEILLGYLNNERQHQELKNHLLGK